jgi:hypothetical protein
MVESGLVVVDCVKRVLLVCREGRVYLVLENQCQMLLDSFHLPRFQMFVCAVDFKVTLQPVAKIPACHALTPRYFR